MHKAGTVGHWRIRGRALLENEEDLNKEKLEKESKDDGHNKTLKNDCDNEDEKANKKATAKIHTDDNGRVNPDD